MRWKEVMEKVGGLYRQLSSAQKATLLAVTVLLALLPIVLLRPGDESYGASPPHAGAEAQALYQKARELAKDGAAAPSGTSVVSWLYEGSGWLDLPEKFEAKLLDSKCRLIEQSIRWNKDIGHAVIAVHRGPQPLLGRQNSSTDSAAVVLRLREGCDRLPRREARAIRSLIQGAFNLLPENIALIDSNLHPYEASPAPYAMDDEEESLGRKIEEDAGNFLSRAYARHEFAVSVNVHFSGRSSSIEKQEYDPQKTFTQHSVTESTRNDGGLNAPPSSQEQPGGNLLQERKEELRLPSLEKSSIKIPAGEVLGVRVNVLLDIDAVRRAIGGEDVSRYESQLEEFISNLVPYENTEVTVMAQPFTRPPPVIQPDPADPSPAEIPVYSKLPADWLSDWWWKPLLGGSVVLAVMLLLAGSGRRRRAQRNEAAGRAADLGMPAGLASLRGEPGTQPGPESHSGHQPGRLPQGILRSVDELGRSVRERPEVAASVVRLWLAQDLDGREDPAE